MSHHSSSRRRGCRCWKATGACQGESHRAGCDSLAQAQYPGRNVFGRSAGLKVSCGDHRNDLGVDLELSDLADLRPDFLVIHDDAVVNRAHILAQHRLVVAEAVCDKPAVTHDEIRIIGTHLAQQPGNFVIGAVDVVGACAGTAGRWNPVHAAAHDVSVG